MNWTFFYFSDRFFVIIMCVGVIVIISGFSLIDPQSLIDDKFFTQKDKLVGIGIVFSIVHVVLTNVVRVYFKKINHANSLINKELQSLKSIDTAKTEFMAMISHELKTPLVPILAYTRMLKDEKFGKLSEDEKEKLAIVLEASESLAILVQDILDLQKAELGKLRLNCKMSNLKEIVDEAIERIFPLANRCGVRVVNHVDVNTELWLDPNRMIQVFSNLFRNSIDFVPPGEGIIQILLDHERDHVLIIVKDNGCGIPKEKINNLFKKFYQIDTSSTRERGGTGLGLPSCKSIVENHGGTISVNTKIDKGTTFSIKIPKRLEQNQ